MLVVSTIIWRGYSLKDNAQTTMPPPQKKTWVKYKFRGRKSLECLSKRLAIEKPLTGFSELQEKIINEQILTDLEPDQLRYFSESDGSFTYSSQEESGDTQDDGIVELFNPLTPVRVVTARDEP